MTERVRGSVINVHALGAAVRLEDGRLVAVPLVDVNKNRASYTRALGQKTTLPFDLEGRSVRLATTRVDEPIVPTSTKGTETRRPSSSRTAAPRAWTLMTLPRTRSVTGRPRRRRAA